MGRLRRVGDLAFFLSRHKRHVLRRMADGRWVCSGGPRADGALRCPFTTPTYVDAVNHATQYGATPPDMPRGEWATA